MLIISFLIMFAIMVALFAYGIMTNSAEMMWAGLFFTLISLYGLSQSILMNIEKKKFKEMIDNELRDKEIS